MTDLHRLALHGSVADIADWLRAATDADRAEAKTWLLDESRSELKFDPNPTTLDAIHRVERYRAFVLGLLPPAEAAKRLTRLTVSGDLELIRHPNKNSSVAAIAIDRGQNWCAIFVSALDKARLVEFAACRYVLMRPVIDAYSLPTPEGAAFTQGWVSSHIVWDPETGTTVTRRELLAADLRLVELFTATMKHNLANQLPQFGRLIAEFVGDGTLDRAAVIATCFAMLAEHAKPGTQIVMARMFTELVLSEHDPVPALPALLHHIAAAHGSVAKALLPCVLRQLDHVDDLRELALTIANRPEKQIKSTLVRHIARMEADGGISDEFKAEALDCFIDDADATVRELCPTGAARPGHVFEWPAVTARGIVGEGDWTATPQGAAVVGGDASGRPLSPARVGRSAWQPPSLR